MANEPLGLDESRTIRFFILMAALEAAYLFLIAAMDHIL